MKKYIYVPGADNTEFWNFSHLLKEKGKQIGFRWSGPYAVTTYVNENGELWEKWNNEDYGIPYSIERIF